MIAIVCILGLFLQSNACDKQRFKPGQSLLKRATSLFSKSAVPEQPFDLDFYAWLKLLPAELKVSIWHEYNRKNHNYMHDTKGHNYIIPFDQYFSNKFLEKHLKRYKDAAYLDNSVQCHDYPVRKIKDCNDSSGILYIPEKGGTKKDPFRICNDGWGVGPSSQSNIKIFFSKNSLKIKKINEENISWQSDNNLADKTSCLCVHPEKNQFIVGYPLSLFTVSNDSNSGQLQTERKKLALPPAMNPAHGLKAVILTQPCDWDPVSGTPENDLSVEASRKSESCHSSLTSKPEFSGNKITEGKTIKFGPNSSLIVQESQESEVFPCALFHYDYEKQKIISQIDVKQLFNTYLQNDPVLHKKIYERIYSYTPQKGHRPKWPFYSNELQYDINLLDFIYPTSYANYLLLKFSVKTFPFSCRCDYFALYDIASKMFLYIGDKINNGSIPDYDFYLPSCKTIKKSSIYTYVYDFINYQSNGPFHTFCYDDVLNTNDDRYTNKLPSRKMVAIVPDDDIARLEQMIIASIAHNWCKQEKAPTTKGYEILRHLIYEAKCLETDQNPFKQKRLFLLQRLAEQMAKQLNIDLQEHIRKHLNEYLGGQISL